MAPSRKKGAGKAAAAVAACRQWKVGDLVLAKVKGFPAWPAVVSEPEKWGCKKAEKKVFVFFFGTQQIAFCNPGDVEAFTEEKKQTLLTKRQGKGADFSRAVREIIESYELKKQDQINGCNSAAVENTLGNGENSLESSAHVDLKDHDETVKATITSRNDSGSFIYDIRNGPENGFLHDKEVILEQPTVEVMVMEAPILSKERTGGLQLRTSVTCKMSPSIERSRSSSREEPCRLQCFTMLSTDGSKSAGNASSNTTHEGSVRGNKQVGSSPNSSQCNVVDSSAIVSNGGIEDNGSEVALDSDSFSLNEGSTTDSGSQAEHSETVLECLEGNAEFSKGLQYQIRPVVRKKKRKANRKRGTKENIEPTSGLDTDSNMDVRMPDSENLQNACENSGARSIKEDGDEHLPLVKRARVRMGKVSTWEEENNCSTQNDTKVSNVVAVSPTEAGGKVSCLVEVNDIEHSGSPMHCDDDCFYDKDSLTVDGAMKNSSPLSIFPENQGHGPELKRARENQSFGCSADGEAALPPLKRLHRALEAMSANAAESCRTYPSTAETLTAGTVEEDSSTLIKTPSLTTENENKDNLVDQTLEALDRNKLEEHNNSVFLEENFCTQSIDTQNSKYPEELPRTMNHVDEREPEGPSSGTLAVCSPVPSCSLMPNLDRRQSSPPTNQQSFDQLSSPKDSSPTNQLSSPKDSPPTDQQSFDRLSSPKDNPPTNQQSFDRFSSPKDNPPTNQQSFDRFSSPKDKPPTNQQSFDQLSSPNDKGKFDDFKLQDCVVEHDKEPDSSNHSGITQNFSSHADEASKIACNNFTDVLHQCVVSDDYQNTFSSRSQVGDDSQALGRSEVADDIKCEQRQNEASNVSISDENPGDKDMHSPSAVDTPAQLSPPAASMCHVSTSGSANIVHSSGRSSPIDHLHQKKGSCGSICDETKEDPQREKPIGKCSNDAEAHSALSSFEGIFASLTRTKESIGRATRIAIECARLGVSSKVVEILARNLESESSLSRKVDIFFLVDSIMQFSRGMKGELGGIYPSAIQAVLPRLLSAAAPAGGYAQENRRQCMKVLRVWLERKILSESIIRQHLRELDRLGGSSSAGAYARRSARNERAFDDPVRQMEGMLVDEYGSNSSFQLPGLCMPRMVKVEDIQSDSDGEEFEAVTPEHETQVPEAQEVDDITKKHRHLLEDVDGELEMEDVAPPCDVEATAPTAAPQIIVNNQLEGQPSMPFVPPLPLEVPPSSPPLPATPPPPPPPPPPPLHANSSFSCVQDDFGRQEAHHSVTPRISHSISNGKQYHAPESNERMHMRPSDSTTSFNNYPVAPVNSGQYNDGPNYHHRAYPTRPPHAAPPDHFSYPQASHHSNSRRDSPPPYSRRYNSWRNADGGSYHNNYERMRRDPYERSETWRYGPPNYPGPRYPGRFEDPYDYEPPPYRGPARESNRHHGWGYHQREMHHRNFIPYRHPPEAPSIWRPR